MVERTVATKGFHQHALLGIGVIIIVFGGLVLCASLVEISGAIVAPGTVAAEGGARRVQHREGGIVKQIFVENGDLVQSGDLLVRLDGTMVAANLAVTVSQLTEAYAVEARVVAESAGLDTVMVRPGLESWPETERLKVLIAAQQRLLHTRADVRKGLVARLEEQIEQTENQIQGLEAQGRALQEQNAILVGEREGLEKLYTDGLVEVGRVNMVRREVAQNEGEAGRLISEIAGARTMIAERRLQITQAADEFQTELLQEQQENGQKIAELQQQRIASEDLLSRLDIKAPVSGVVHESSVKTVGGVVAAGDTLMLIIPQGEALVLEARVAVTDIDKIFVGQPTTVRLPSFDARTTPEISAKVKTLSADLSHDPRTGEGYYLARVALGTDELSRLPEGRILVPGMPGEAFMMTEDRSILSYLLHPFTEQVKHAFREE